MIILLTGLGGTGNGEQGTGKRGEKFLTLNKAWY